MDCKWKNNRIRNNIEKEKELEEGNHEKREEI